MQKKWRPELLLKGRPAHKLQSLKVPAASFLVSASDFLLWNRTGRSVDQTGAGRFCVLQPSCITRSQIRLGTDVCVPGRDSDGN
jgi:hypothetical protein